MPCRSSSEIIRNTTDYLEQYWVEPEDRCLMFPCFFARLLDPLAPPRAKASLPSLSNAASSLASSEFPPESLLESSPVSLPTCPWKGWLRNGAIASLGLVAIAYISLCTYLYTHQREILYNPRRNFWRLPSAVDIQVPYDDLMIEVTPGQSLHGWFLHAPGPQDKPDLADEPFRILSTPKVMLYLYGRAGNKSSGYLYRAAGVRQLGFSVLLVDYRGYGPSYGSSGGEFPMEQQFYEDAEAAFRYLVHQRRIPPQDIVIYGESLGGAIAIDLAKRYPEAGALIVQSSFTSMTDAIRQNPWMRLLPIDWILTEKFASLEKLRSLREDSPTLPILIVHGLADEIIAPHMSQQLYAASPQTKQLFLVPGGTHFKIYQPGDASYLKAIAHFMQTMARP